MEHTFFLPNFFVNLSYWKLNSEQKDISLCFHGWLDNADSFLPLAKSIDNRQIYSFDMIGHGFSDHLPQGSSYNILLFAQHFYDLIQAKNWKEVSIIAHSLGTSVALILAAVMPEKIKELILIEGFGPFTRDHHDFCDYFKEANSSLYKKNKTQLKSYSSIEEAAYDRAKKTDIDLASAKIICSRNLKKKNDSYFWRTDPRLFVKPIYPLTEEHFCEFIKKVRCPIKLFLASNGFVRRLDFLKTRIEKLRAPLDIIDIKGHHHAHLQSFKSIKDFLRS